MVVEVVDAFPSIYSAAILTLRSSSMVSFCLSPCVSVDDAKFLDNSFCLNSLLCCRRY